MKKLLVTFIVLLVALQISAQDRKPVRADLALGSPMPSFTIESSTYGKISSSDLKGKVVLINLFATWCLGPMLVRNPVIMREVLHCVLGEDFLIKKVKIFFMLCYIHPNFDQFLNCDIQYNQFFYYVELSFLAALAHQLDAEFGRYHGQAAQ